MPRTLGPGSIHLDAVHPTEHAEVAQLRHLWEGLQGVPLCAFHLDTRVNMFPISTLELACSRHFPCARPEVNTSALSC